MTAGAASSLQCPVFQATHKDLQAQSFAEYVEAHEPDFEQAGVCIIRTPRGWKPRKEGYAGLDFTIPRPIRQHATGRQGLYRTLMLMQKKMTLKQFQAMAEDPVNAPPPGADFDMLERKYWKNVAMNPPIYGADVDGSLFNQECKGWNLGCLESLLSRTMREHRVEIPGVNSPYLYVGSWRSTFAWHTEDMDLHSVNYLHFGAPKTWYVIPPEHRRRFEVLMEGMLPDLFRECHEFLRHKELVVSPSLLQAHNIPVVRLEQRPGDFVVTYPGAYHCGFNQGFNCAESVNFATKRWVDIGALAGCCRCRQDTVRVDMRMFRQYMSQDIWEELFTSDTESELDSGSEPASHSEGWDSEGGEETSATQPATPSAVDAEPERSLSECSSWRQGGDGGGEAVGERRGGAQGWAWQPPPPPISQPVTAHIVLLAVRGALGPVLGAVALCGGRAARGKAAHPRKQGPVLRVVMHSFQLAPGMGSAAQHDPEGGGCGAGAAFQEATLSSGGGGGKLGAEFGW